MTTKTGQIPPQLRPFLFKPGQSGNVSGHGTGANCPDVFNLIRARLTQQCDVPDLGHLMWIDALADAELHDALDSWQARHALYNRLYGKIAETVQMQLQVRVMRPADMLALVEATPTEFIEGECKEIVQLQEEIKQDDSVKKLDNVQRQGKTEGSDQVSGAETSQ